MIAKLFGTPESVYVRIVRLILEVKKIPYDLVKADVFDEASLPPDYERRHPFKRIPAIEIDGVGLYETDAIAHYLDALSPNPGMIPVDALESARMRQIMRVVDAYAYRSLVWGIYVPLWWREGQDPTVEAFATGRRALDALADLMTDAFMSSPPTLGWCYLAAVLAVTDSVEPGKALIDDVPRIRSWWNGIRESAPMIATRSRESLY